MNTVVLDISRLISRIRYRTPSGVDRVEMAYARGLLARYGNDLDFAAVHPLGWQGRLPRDAALHYLDTLEESWGQENNNAGSRSVVSIIPSLLRLRPYRAVAPATASSRVYVQVSPHHLTRPTKVRAMLAREGARFLCMVHDLIPIEYPEYARPTGGALHRSRMKTVAELADAVIVNSAATGRSFSAFATKCNRAPEIHVALLGTEPLLASLSNAASSPQQACPDRPYFVCVGTIEPRKNHLLLLNLWRRFAQTLPPAAVPRLIIVGRRGWENEQVLDMLDRCPTLVDHVEEINGCSDRRLATLLRQARALLMPSFAEGFGLPIAEALSVGVPVICSDIAAHREVGGETPDYLDPLDGVGWAAMILNHANNGTAALAQRARLAAWHAPTWDEHIAIVANAIGQLQTGANH